MIYFLNIQEHMRKMKSIDLIKAIELCKTRYGLDIEYFMSLSPDNFKKVKRELKESISERGICYNKRTCHMCYFHTQESEENAGSTCVKNHSDFWKYSWIADIHTHENEFNMDKFDDMIEQLELLNNFANNNEKS